MSQDPQDKEVVVQYLLGALSESETERLDQLSITDDEFADSLRAAEHDLVDAYVRGELSDADQQRFRSSHLGRPNQQHRMAFARALQEWAPKNGAPEPVTEPKSKKRGAGVSWFFDPQRVALRWATLAAVLILFAIAGLLLLQNLRSRSQSRQAQTNGDQLTPGEQESPKQVESQPAVNSNTEPQTAGVGDEQKRRGSEVTNAGVAPSPGGRIVAFSLAPPMREAGQIRSVTIPPDTSTVRVRLELEADYPAYRVQLVDSAAGQTLWHSANLKPATSAQGKMIELSLPASLLKSGDYLLRVSGGGEAVGDYSFRVIR